LKSCAFDSFCSEDLLAMDVYCGGNGGRLLFGMTQKSLIGCSLSPFITFPFTIILMWSIWNGYSLSNWLWEGTRISQECYGVDVQMVLGNYVDCEANGFYLPVQCFVFWINF